MWGFQTFGNSRSFVDYGDLKENRPHRLIHSNACIPVSEIVWEGLEGVVLLETVQPYLEEVCDWGWTLRLQKPVPGPAFLSLPSAFG